MHTVFISVYIHISLHTSSYSRKRNVCYQTVLKLPPTMHTPKALQVHKHLSNVVDFTSTQQTAYAFPLDDTRNILYISFVYRKCKYNPTYIRAHKYARENIALLPLQYRARILNFYGAQESSPGNQFRQLM